MSFLFHVSQDHPDIAAEEIRALCSPVQLKRTGEFLISTKAPLKSVSRLAYTRSVYRVLFTETEHSALKAVAAYRWSNVIHGAFKVSTSDVGIPARDLAGQIWHPVANPSVNLLAPKTHIVFLGVKNRIYASVLLWKQAERYEARRAHLRPGFSPTSLHPKLARALVNLSGSRSCIIDPFCGTGGILIEAGLMGLGVTGYDADPDALIKSYANLRSLGIKDFMLVRRDAQHFSSRCKFLVTDLPYGKSSKIKGKNATALFLSCLGNIKRAVIVSSDGDLKKSIKLRTNLKIVHHFKVYIHKSMTRHIFVLEK